MSNQDLAQELKQQGNAAYKAKKFDDAIGFYNRAIELEPFEIIYYTNLAAVYFEKKDYAKCISTCDRAIEIGRENRADFKLIAKAFARKGNALRRSGDFQGAKVAFEKALTEHRTPDYKTALTEIEACIKKQEAEAYVDPAQSEAEKTKGNELFKKGDYSGAVKHYTEAIKRNPKDAKIYSNRAACYTKLMSFDLGLVDCETAIKIDPSFVKAYLRKAKCLQGMGQASKAMSVYETALELDPNCNEALEGYKNCSIQTHSDPEETRRRAMNDPEIQQILNDPAMRMILEQMQSDPQAIQEHLKNPHIAEKFLKLREAGLVSVAYR